MRFHHPGLAVVLCCMRYSLPQKNKIKSRELYTHMTCPPASARNHELVEPITVGTLSVVNVNRLQQLEAVTWHVNLLTRDTT